MQELEIFRFNETLNDKGILIDRKTCEELVAVCDYIAEENKIRVQDLTEGKVSSVTAVEQCLRWIRKQGVDIPDLRADTVTAYLSQKDSLPPDIVSLLQYRQIGAKSSVKKLTAILSVLDDDNRAHGVHFYYGAHTGRFSSKLIQVHNLPRGMKLGEDEIDRIISALAIDGVEHFVNFLEREYGYDQIMNVISSLVRPMIIAPPDHSLVISDYSAIETRVLAWAANCQPLLNAYREGTDVYKLMASKVFSKEIADVDSGERQIGKALILGCGYGMGAAKFRDTCGIEISDAAASFYVDSYRNTFPEVPKFWRGVERAFTEAVNTGRDVTYGNLRIFTNRQFTFIELPNGRCLSYPLVEIEENVDDSGWTTTDIKYYRDTQGSWGAHKLWGGILTENIVQAMARDILVDGMLAVDKAGFPVTFSVHDEVVCEVPEHRLTSDNLTKFDRLLTTSSSWCSDLPLAVETEISQRYKK